MSDDVRPYGFPGAERQQFDRPICSHSAVPTVLFPQCRYTLAQKSLKSRS